MLGDILHNLRSALDIAVNEFLERDQKRRVARFPFAQSDVLLKKEIKDSKCYMGGKALERAITNIKPFKGGNIALWTLHELNIQDKHRALIPAVMHHQLPAMAPVVHEGKMKIATLQPQAFNQLEFPQDSAFAGRELVEGLKEMLNAAIAATNDLSFAYSYP